jgi:hypothetical protein
VAAVRDASGISLWLNGTRIHNTTVAGSGSLHTPTQPTTIGLRPNNDQDFLGYISDWSWSVGTAKYATTSTSITPPTAPVGNTNASLYLPFDNAGIFDKTGNHDLTLLVILQHQLLRLSLLILQCILMVMVMVLNCLVNLLN